MDCTVVLIGKIYAKELRQYVEFGTQKMPEARIISQSKLKLVPWKSNFGKKKLSSTSKIPTILQAHFDAGSKMQIRVHAHFTKQNSKSWLLILLYSMYYCTYLHIVALIYLFPLSHGTCTMVHTVQTSESMCVLPRLGVALCPNLFCQSLFFSLPLENSNESRAITRRRTRRRTRALFGASIEINVGIGTNVHVHIVFEISITAVKTCQKWYRYTH